TPVAEPKTQSQSFGYLQLALPVLMAAFQMLHRLAITPINLAANKRRTFRQLEIGPGRRRVPGCETLSIAASGDVDYVVDASKGLPFADGTFDTIYASHVAEHIPWYQCLDALKEWTRVLKPGGTLEIWVPNGLEIAKAFVDAETGSENRIHLDGWYKFNPSMDPCVWANGRIFSYGSGDGDKRSPNWH